MNAITASSMHVDLKNEGLKRQLLHCLEEETRRFLPIAEHFYGSSRRSEQEDIQLCEALISTMEHVLKAADWEASLFLKNTLKPLKTMYTHVLQLQENLNRSTIVSHQATPIAENIVLLYISLYQAEGHDLHQWAKQLSSLSSYMMGRPIYRCEEEVQRAVRLKLSQTSEAYVVVAVHPTQILSREEIKPRKDRSGHVLVNVLPGAVDVSGIVEFVHQGKHYYFRNQHLVLKERHGVK